MDRETSERMYQDRVPRSSKELADLERKGGQETAKLNKVRADGDRLLADVARTRSSSVARSKQSQAQPSNIEVNRPAQEGNGQANRPSAKPMSRSDPRPESRLSELP